MKLKFPNDVSEYHSADGTCHRPDADGNLSTDTPTEFIAAGFTHAETVIIPDTSALTTIDIEGEQKIPQGANHGTE